MPADDETVARVAAIAAGLTKAQKRIVLAAPCIGPKEPHRRLTKLLDLGLGDCTIRGNDDGERWSFSLTPLGIAIREHFLTQGSET